jgi:hypothetical protein
MTRLIYDICHVGLSHLSLVINLVLIYIGALYPITGNITLLYWGDILAQEVAYLFPIFMI